MSQPGVLNVVSSSLTLAAMRGQLRYLRDRGFNVSVISPPGERLEEVARTDGVKVIEMAIVRKISALHDLLALWCLWRTIRALRPTVTNVGTPKAGLLGGFAAWLNRVPCRVYTLRGLRFETTTGWKRRLLIYAERLACSFAHSVICVSQSVREKAIASGLITRERTVVFGSGSSNGVDPLRFAPSPEMIKRATLLRHELDIPPQVPIVGFAGRFTRDKGIPELLEAFLQLEVQFPGLHLLLVGAFEDHDPLPAETRKLLESHPRVVLAGHRLAGVPVDDIPPYYALMDILVLPSHREGLPNVILEAQAAGKPVVGARATGVVDAVLDSETGLLFPVGNATALAGALATLLSDKELASKLALAGQERVRREFRQEQIWEALYHEYLRLLRTRDLPLPAIPFLTHGD